MSQLVFEEEAATHLSLPGTLAPRLRSVGLGERGEFYFGATQFCFTATEPG